MLARHPCSTRYERQANYHGAFGSTTLISAKGKKTDSYIESKMHAVPLRDEVVVPLEPPFPCLFSTLLAAVDDDILLRSPRSG